MNRNIYKLLSCARQKFSEVCAQSSSVILRMTELGEAVRGRNVALALTVFSYTAYSQTTYTFFYTGSTQTISLPTGNYSIECWGADGGSANNGTTLLPGGKGGYSRGVYTNTATATFNVYVGGRGGNASGAAQVGSGGGGMSDIAPAANTTLVIIAAGGGGGSTSGGTINENSTGGDSGGLIGATAIDGAGVTGGTAATGGSQIAGGFATAGSYGAGTPGGYGYGGGAANGGTAGVMHSAGGGGGNGGIGGWNGGGGGCTLTGINDHAGGGGAGYYGGGGGRGDGGAGGGGSSYIGGVTSGTTIMFANPGFVTNPDVLGNGRMLITELCSISLVASGNNSLNPSICAGQSVTLSTNAVSNYSWSTGATSSVLVVAPVTTTVYTLTATSSSSCTTARTITVTVSPGLPTLTITASALQVCASQSVVLTANGAVSYTWTGITNGVAFAPTTTSLYVVTGANGCGTATAGITISVAPLPVSVASTHSAVCSNNTATLMATAAATVYNWQPGVASTASAAIVSPQVNTIYTVTASNGTCSGTATVNLISNPVPTVVSSPLTVSICPGETTTLTATGGVNYTWSPGGSTLSSIVVSPVTVTAYTVVGNNSFGCQAVANPIVLVGQQPTLTAGSSNNFVCSGQSVTLTVTGANNYLWTGGPATSNYVVNPTQATGYIVTGTLLSSGCTATAAVNINVFLPVMNITGNATICSGSSATLTANAPGGNTYIWNPGNQQVQSFVVSPTSNTIYSVSAISSSNTLNCPVDGTVMVTVNPSPTLAVASPSAICIKETRIISASGASSYTWSLLGSTIGTSSNVSISSPITGFLSYTVTGSNSFGCTSSKTVLIIANACTGIETISVANTSLRVYPNPSQGDFFISSENQSDSYRIQLNILDETGRLIKEVQLNEQNAYTAEIHGLANGIYFIHSKDSQQIINLKIVVTK